MSPRRQYLTRPVASLYSLTESISVNGYNLHFLAAAGLVGAHAEIGIDEAVDVAVEDGAGVADLAAADAPAPAP